MKKIFTSSPEFYILYLLFFMVSASLLFVYGKANIEIWCNSHNSIFLDKFFAVYTNIGDGLFAGILGFALLFYKTGYGIMIGASNILAGIIAQLLKHQVFDHVVRPKVYFKGIYDLHFVEGVKVWSSNSMPSGHSATAFAVFLCLAIFVRNSFLRIVFFILAVLVGYSRIYLSQHFLSDVVVGSLIGVVVVTIYYTFHQKIKAEWYHKPIYALFKKK
jgi:membrane-associated phospholipid phosphatase